MSGVHVGLGVRVAAVAVPLVLLAAPAGAQVAIPEHQELAVGRAIAARLMAQHGLVVDADWLAFLGNLLDRLVPFSGRPDVPYRIAILDHGQPNAVSTPGWLFVTTGLIRLNPDVDTWAFVLAHEISHTSRRHVAQLLARYQAGQVFSVLIAVLTGAPAVGDLAQLLLQVSTLGFARELELEADREALRMLVEAGFDPQAAPRALSWFNEVTVRRQENTHWAGTHPGFSDRVRAVQRAYEELTGRGLPLRVRHFRGAVEVGPVVVRPVRLAELQDSWLLWMVVSNTTDRPATVLVTDAVLRGPDGELAIRFLRSTLPSEVPPRGQVEGSLVFEKRTAAWPQTLVLAVSSGSERLETQVDLTAGGPFTPAPQPAGLPRPPALP